MTPATSLRWDVYSVLSMENSGITN